MGDVLLGFSTLGLVIGTGFLLAHLGVVDLAAQQVLSRVAFYVANPALLVTVLAGSDVGAVFSLDAAALALAVVLTVGLYVLVDRLVWRSDRGEATIGALSASYANAGNLGIPVAAYVLGDAALVAPLLLLQLVVIQPIAIVLLDSSGRAGRSWYRAVLTPLTNPLTLGSILGVVLSATDATLPPVVDDPLSLVGGMAVPGVLVAYGISLRLGPKPGAGGSAWRIAMITVLKLVVQPTAAWAIARFVFDADGASLFAVTVLAALPTAQNIFVYATRYDRGVALSRDAIFATTVLSVPVVITVAALLG
ncbi:AEC family transporter [Solicola sp. PLA-1-18]|uniref:AEC family transporter n=1 Tax=Solicola sp. PLA-1-18 TaxID=3380532 RepID=UPI003B793A63